MFMTNAQFCDFVVYTPTQTSIERFLPNYEYVREFLIPRALQFYFGKYLPMMVAQKKGYLQNGQCEMPEDVQVEYYKPNVDEFFANYGIEQTK